MKDNCLQIQFLPEKKNWYFSLVPESEKFTFALMIIKHTSEFRWLGLACYIIAENYYLIKSQ